MKEVIPKWYEEYVEPDAKAPENRYPGPPEVSPIESDGISQGDHTYLSISINTAMSINSNISNDSPPSFIFPKDQQSTTDESTLGGSQANSSNIGRTWADKVRGSRTYSSSEPTSTAESERQRALQQELAISREEVAALKDRLAKIEGARIQDQELETSRLAIAELKETIAHMEQERNAERESIDDKVKQQVAQALQAQFQSFAQEMTTMFAQMLRSQQQHSPQNPIKRQASDINEEFKEEDHILPSGEDSIKRRDNKKTPVKKHHKSHNNPGSEEWHTPQYLQEIASQQSWTNSPKSQINTSSRNHSLIDGISNNNGSESEDDDRDTDGSGNESINKSLEDLMEAEAIKNNHD